jgi:hypothetical protein
MIGKKNEEKTSPKRQTQNAGDEPHIPYAATTFFTKEHTRNPYLTLPARI